MRLLILITLTLFLNYGFAQFTNTASVLKPAIDTSVFGAWPKPGTDFRFAITNDAKYTLTIIKNRKSKHNAILTIRSVNGKNVREFDDVNYAAGIPVFTTDSKNIVFVKGKDSLIVIQVNSHKIRFIGRASSFSLIGKDVFERLIYKTGLPPETLVVHNLLTGLVDRIDFVMSYSVSPKQTKILLTTKDGMHDTVSWFDTVRRSVTQIFTDIIVENYAFDDEEEQVAFVISGTNRKYIWLKKLAVNGTFRNSPAELLMEELPGINVDALQFNKDGHKILFRSRIIGGNRSDDHQNAGLLLWTYLDLHLPTAKDILPAPVFSIIDSNSKNVIVLNEDTERIIVSSNVKDYVLSTRLKSLSDNYQEYSDRDIPVLIDIRTGRGTKIFNEKVEQCTFSPDERFIIAFDKAGLNWLSYEISTGITRNITEKIPFPVYDEEALKSGRKSEIAFDIVGWAKENIVYLNDQYDIWKIDLTNVLDPVNLTLQEGRNNKIVLGLIAPIRVSNSFLFEKGDWLLSAYSPSTKQSGFWKLSFETMTSSSLRKGDLGNYAYPINNFGYKRDHETTVVYGSVKKIGKTDKYLVPRQNAEEYQNYFITTDFRNYKAVSNFQPQKMYCWVTSELLNWDRPGGKTSSGILYKPENFDSTKKYPVIFTYYQRRSDQLHRFIIPDFASDRIDSEIPYYVSNGYLVFIPDIYYQPGHFGESVVESIESAARYLSKFCFVDSTKYGLQGHSFAGWETNFIITHSGLFAAACEASGSSDHISSYDQLSGTGVERQVFFERDAQGTPYGVGITPWTATNLYVENSPVLFASSVSTPLLMMHGSLDGAVPFSQAMEMFLALRRAGKKVWLLNYLNEGHSLSTDKAKDYSLRMKQFFDCYLKGMPAPHWMTEGISVTGKRQFVDTKPD